MLPFELKTPRCRCLFSLSFFFGLVCCINYSLIAKRCMQKQFKFTLNSDRWQFLLYLRRPGRIKVQPCPPTNQFDRTSTEQLDRVRPDNCNYWLILCVVWCDVWWLVLAPDHNNNVYLYVDASWRIVHIDREPRATTSTSPWLMWEMVCVCAGSWSILTGIQSSRIVWGKLWHVNDSNIDWARHAMEFLIESNQELYIN